MPQPVVLLTSKRDLIWISCVKPESCTRYDVKVTDVGTENNLLFSVLFHPNFKNHVEELIMCDLKQCLMKTVFLTAVLVSVPGQASDDHRPDLNIKQLSSPLISEAELYEQFVSPLTGDFIPGNEFFLWGSESIAIGITDVVGEFENISNLFQGATPEPFNDFQEYFF